MKGLYPIIRRVRRPLLPVEAPVAGPAPQPANAPEDKGEEASNGAALAGEVQANATNENATQEDY